MSKIQDFITAKEKLSKVLLKTSLIQSPIFSKEAGNEVYIKPENLQKTGSFKIRGAYNKITNLSDEEKKKVLLLHLLETMLKELPMVPKNLE